ncbi:sugar nucleotide-binding protein, partial [Acinetobacter baumannii]
DIIIHNAAMSKPDECEHDKVACLENNVHATEYLLKYSSDHTHFMYISTDFIFGENGPHDENETPAPLNFYGESKLMAEQLVKTMK